MKWSITIARIKGIEVKIHLTFVLILIWAANRWSVSTGEGLTGALFGVVATLLLFASVTLHEFGHSLQALKYGVSVKDITLMPMGGLARIEKIPEDPGQEFRIAIAGPLVNFLIAGVLIGVGLLLDTRTIISLDELYSSMGQVSWAGLLAYLTMTNLLMGLFNLIPAFPMDGGRILRALLAKKMDYAKATSIASNVGQGLAFLMGLGGFMSGSYTLVLIAIFVWMGAGQENKGVQLENNLGEFTVQQAMSRSSESLQANDPLSKAVDLTLTTFQSDFPVLKWGTKRIEGLLCEIDLIKGLQSSGKTAFVREVMRTSFPTIAPDALLLDAHQRMQAARLRSIPVVDENKDFVGMLRIEDINEAYRLLSLESQSITANA